jgi:hypothetical protein
MSPLLLTTILYFTLLSISCYSVSKTCTVQHYPPQLSLHKGKIVYEHTLQYCNLNETVYTDDKDRIDDWIMIHREKTVYHTMWGNMFHLGGLYMGHAVFTMGLFAVVAVIYDEVEKERRIRAIYKK